ncbi:single-stranded DNA-binding protein [Coralloluteibacterium thermophilus]|uniref:Single-stranded DNA-binding protein n=1 Tax=Coralloluteibacterium thermophilum TaxID=2707049 RepID=A0ABV9NQ33_9GAMM
MFIEIKSNTLSGIREYKGRQYGDQQAALFMPGADYPLPFKVNVPADAAHAPGRYTLDGSGFGTDQHGNLRLNRVRLVPLAAPTGKAAAA